MVKDVKIAKMNTELQEICAKIAHIRFINGLDKRPSPPKVQGKILKHPLWKDIEEDLKIVKFLKDGF